MQYRRYQIALPFRRFSVRTVVPVVIAVKISNNIRFGRTIKLPPGNLFG
ncbi:hypothetical protein [Spirosoma sp. KNUC1025]|nr:hypothetical protein LN737_03295 [Spirosoma sp. KNUC1025]